MFVARDRDNRFWLGKQIVHGHECRFGGRAFATASDQTFETVLFIEGQQVGFVGLRQTDGFQRGQLGHIGLQIAIGANFQKLTASWQPIYGLAQIFTHHPFDLIGIEHQLVERAVFKQKFDRRFGAYFLHTWHIVDRVTHQNLIVQHQAGRYTKFFLYTRQVAAFAIHGVNDGDVFVHQLGQVLVAT